MSSSDQKSPKSDISPKSNTPSTNTSSSSSNNDDSVGNSDDDPISPNSKSNRTYSGRPFGRGFLIPLPEETQQHADEVLAEGYNFPPCHDNPTPSEYSEWRKKKKLHQNKASVKACRIRRMGYIKALELENSLLSEEIKMLQERKNQLVKMKNSQSVKSE